MLLLALGVLGLAGCRAAFGDDTSDAQSDTAVALGREVEVRGTDYSFGDVPDEVEAGTRLSFTNTSEREVHKMIVLRVDDDEPRTLEELMSIPGSEAKQVTSFTGIRLALPGEAGIDPENPSAEAELTLSDPGRYLLLCFIPEGADPQAYRDALESPNVGPPDVEGGSPHAVLGMADELIVTG